MKITIKSKGFKDAKILLDDKDISNRVLKAIVDIEGGYVSTVTLKLHPDDIEIDGDFEVLKDLKESKEDSSLKLSHLEQAFIMAAEQIKNEKAINITINSPDINNDVMKEIVDRISKTHKDRERIR